MSARSNDGLPPNRRIVVVRSPNNPNVHQGPVDLKEYEHGNTLDLPAVISDGSKSVYLLRRTIPPSKSDARDEPIEHHSPIPTPPPLPPSENTASPSPHPSPVPFRPKSSRPAIQTQTPAKKSERLKQMTQTSFRDSTRRKTVPTSSSSPPVNENYPMESRDSPTSIINTELEQEKQRKPRVKSAYQKKSAKSMVFVNPEDQSIAVIENSFVKGESIRPVIIKRPEKVKKTRFEDRKTDDSREELVEKNRSQGCLGCLSRCICLIIIICILLVIIGLAGVGVGAYFLAIDSVNNLTPAIVGICVGGVLAIGGICFLYIVLACIGTRDGYFTYSKNDSSAPSTGRAYALIPPSHRNAHLYTPRDYSRMVETNHPTSLVTPVSTVPLTRSTAHHESRPVKPNITIEVPERLLTGRKLSPRSRERSLNKVVKNLGHIVEDAKKHCNGDMPSKVIVKVDDHTDGK